MVSASHPAGATPMSEVSWVGIGGAIGAFLTGLFAWLIQRSKGGTDIEVAVLAEWQKLNGAQSEEIRRLGERCQRLEGAEERCRTELAEAVKRLSTLEGYEHGQGKARQEAAQIVAIERLESSKKDGDK